MAWVIVGLGNPGAEYEGTRHNAGRMAVEYFARSRRFGDLRADKKKKATVGAGMIGARPAALVLPDTFMNKSGEAVAKFIKSAKAAERLIVAHDDLDLPAGAMKISFDRGSGGHRGIESIMRALKTKKFTRVRIGIAGATGAGKIRKPSGEKEVNDFILGKFKTANLEKMKKIFKTAADAIETVVGEGREIAMNRYN